MLKPRWYQRVSFAIEIRVAGFEESTTPSNWVFDYSVALERISKGRKVFWPRAWIRVLGISIGAGLFIDYDKYETRK